MKKNKKQIAIIAVYLLVFILALYINTFVGNPISKMIASNSAKEYINKNYANLDIELEGAMYSFKDGNYHVHVTSPTSKDTNFSITITPFGNIQYDTYEDYVLSGFNTYSRLNEEYSDKISKVIHSKEFLYKGDIAFGEIMDKEAIEHEYYNNLSYGVKLKELELDKDYDIYELGKEAGHIVFYAEDKDVSAEKASDILLYIKDRLDENNLCFYAIDFTLEKNRVKDGSVNLDDEININHFLYEDIYEKNLEDRVSESIEITKEYYKKLDLEKDKQEEMSKD